MSSESNVPSDEMARITAVTLRFFVVASLQGVGDCRSIAADQVEQLSQVRLRTCQNNECGSTLRGADDGGPTLELDDRTRRGTASGGSAEFVELPEHGDGKCRESIPVQRRGQRVINQQTLGADQGDTSDFGAGGETLDQGAEHGQTLRAQSGGSQGKSTG